jgi:L-ascorbate metabolism protein UlaG (beta-lactamase superfamily)
MGKRTTRAKRLAQQVAPVVGEYLGVRTPDDPAPPPGGPLDHDAWNDAELGVYWLGQATVLIRVGGVTILTDPHFGEHAAPRVAGRPTGRRRSTALPMSIDDLPPVDVVLLSHAHMDHWETESLRRLARPETEAVIPRRTRRLLPANGRRFGRIVEAHWGATVGARGLSLTALKPRHWGARYLVDWWRGYNAYLIEAGGRRVVFAGDTGDTDTFDGLGGVDLAVLGIGSSYEPWDKHHASPEQAAGMAERMGARLVAPVHHGTFHDPSEGRDEPLERFLRAWPADRTVCARVGETHVEAPAGGG